VFHGIKSETSEPTDRDIAMTALRKSIRLIWAKSGEILCQQGQRVENLVRLYVCIKNSLLFHCVTILG
jgi:hypothetical protein